MNRKTPTLFLALSLAALLAAACGGLGTPAPTAVPTASATDRQLRVFEALWTAVNDDYVYEDFGGVDWQAAGDETRAKIESGLTEEEFVTAIRAMVDQLPDEMVTWETREERLERQTADTSNYEGIGAYVAVRAGDEPHVVLLAVMEGSPAETAGLAAHDSIFAIDGDPVLEEEGLAVIDRVRGPAGSVVTLSVESPGDERRDVEVTRGQLTTTSQIRAGMLTGSEVAYILIPTQAPAEMVSAVLGTWQSITESSPPAGLVLDLRIARTGSQWPLAEMLTMFGDGNLGKTYTRVDEQPLELEGQDFAGTQSVPLVILVGPDTEGAPEIFAGAMQDSGRAQVIGLPTPGFIEGTTATALPDGSNLFVASSSFLTAKGSDLGLEGVVPSVEVLTDWDEVNDVFDPVLDQAVEIIGFGRQTES